MVRTTSSFILGINLTQGFEYHVKRLHFRTRGDISPWTWELQWWERIRKRIFGHNETGKFYYSRKKNASNCDAKWLVEKKR